MAGEVRQRTQSKKDKPVDPQSEKEEIKDRELAHITSSPAAVLLQNYHWEVLLIAILLALTVGKLYYRLDTPREIVWDETHFTKFSSWYFTGHYFVDIHPPLPKLLMAGLIWLSDYEKLDESNVEWWTENGFVGTKDYLNLYNQDAYYFLRFGSLIMGTTLVLATYLTMRLLGCRVSTAAFTAWMVMTDHLITIDSRLILTDIYLWTFHMLTIFSTIATTRVKGRVASFLCYVMTGFFLGCSVSSKYTAFGTIGFVGIHQLVYVFAQIYQSTRLNLKRTPEKRIPFSLILAHYFYVAVFKAVLILGVAALIFCSVWALHLHFLPYSGQGNGFMDHRFNEALVPYFSAKERAESARGGCPNPINSWYDCGHLYINQEECEALGCCWDPTSKQKWCYPKNTPPAPVPKKLPFWKALAKMLDATWANNQGEELNYHPQMSRWWQWPLLTCKFVDFGFGIYSMGNPAVWWLVAATVPVALLSLLLIVPAKLGSSFLPSSKKAQEAESSGVIYAGGLSGWLYLVVFIVGYLGNWLPFYLIVRSTWNYHYMLALLIGMLLTGFSFDYLIRSLERRSLRVASTTVRAVLFLLTTLMAVAFWYWSPWVYGFKISAAEKLALRWHELWGV